MNRTWRRARNVAEIEVGEKLIVCALDGGPEAVPVELSASSAVVWSLLDSTPRTESSLIDDLVHCAAIDRETAAPSIATVVETLEQLHLVRSDAH